MTPEEKKEEERILMWACDIYEDDEWAEREAKIDNKMEKIFELKKKVSKEDLKKEWKILKEKFKKGENINKLLAELIKKYER